MTRNGPFNIPEIDDEFLLYSYPCFSEAIYSLDRWLDGLKECLDFIDNEQIRQIENEVIASFLQ